MRKKWAHDRTHNIRSLTFNGTKVEIQNGKKNQGPNKNEWISE